MHSAPAVSFPVGPSRAARLLLSMLWLAGALGAVCFVGDLDVRAFLLLGSVLLAGGLAWRFGGHRQVGLLRFDGQYWSWSWSGQGALQVAARVQVGLDLQVLMLLRLVEAGRSQRWLWLERRTDPSRWTALRRAVYSRAPTPAADDAPHDASSSGPPSSPR
jgi:toxin CptA